MKSTSSKIIILRLFFVRKCLCLNIILYVGVVTHTIVA
jgi:hypothetical protein